MTPEERAHALIHMAGQFERHEDRTRRYTQAIADAERAAYERGQIAMRERCAELLLNGSFLHDQAPGARLAREAAKAIRRLTPEPEQ